jgi:hypothetical protein
MFDVSQPAAPEKQFDIDAALELLRNKIRQIKKFFRTSIRATWKSLWQLLNAICGNMRVMSSIPVLALARIHRQCGRPSRCFVNLFKLIYARR